MFVRKGYCRFCGSKCWQLKVENGEGYCKKERRYRGKYWSVIRNEKTDTPKNISSDKNVNIKAPKWCPKLKKH